MGFTKIQDSDLSGIGVIGLPDTPGLSTAAMQSKFEETSRSVVIPKHNELIDELEASASANSLGATPVTGRISAPTVQAVMEKLSVDLKTVEDGMAGAIAQAHSHNNKALLDDLDEDSSGKLTYKGSIVGETDYDNLSNHPQINGVTLTGNKTSSDLGINIPDELADLADDGNHRLVTDAEKTAWNNKGNVNDAYKSVVVSSGSTSTTITASGEDSIELTAGANVTMTVDTTTTPNRVTIESTGGGGGGGSYTSGDGILISSNQISVDFGSVDNTSTKKPPTGKAVYDAIGGIEIGDIGKVNISSPSNGQILKYSLTDDEWQNATEGGDADDITYDNTSSHLLATNVQDAIDEVKGNISNATVTLKRNATTNIGNFTVNQSSNSSIELPIDEWTTTKQVDSNMKVDFSDLSLSDSYGYELYCQNKLLGISEIEYLASGGVITKLKYTVTGATNGDVCKLRILK